MVKQAYVELLKKTVPVNRGSWQSRSTDLKTYELSNVRVTFPVSPYIGVWQNQCGPDLPWAEEHFQERISGKPMNPAPSYVDWPWHSQAARDKFVRDGEGVFDHTYPERYWPKNANGGHLTPAGRNTNVPNIGIRFSYGDLGDMIRQLQNEPFTRQAYLPMFFPEDTGATAGQRVPCSLGYHFIRNGPSLDCNYFLRSCDITRHFLNDVYMTGRLLQHVTQQARAPHSDTPFVGDLTVFISNLHMFTQDEWRYE